MKKTMQFVLAFALSWFAHMAFAELVYVPANKPVVTLQVPDSWKPSEIDRGIEVNSPDDVVTMFFEIVKSEKAMNTVLDDNIEWLTEEQNVKINANTKQETDIAVGGIKSSLIGYDAKSKEWGPSKVGFIFTPVGSRVMVTTYWITNKGFAKQEPVVNRILASLKVLR